MYEFIKPSNDPEQTCVFGGSVEDCVSSRTFEPKSPDINELRGFINPLASGMLRLLLELSGTSCRAQAIIATADGFLASRSVHVHLQTKLNTFNSELMTR